MRYVEAALVGLICVFESRYYLHIFQLLSYKLNEYNGWMKKHSDKLFGWTLNIGVGMTAIYFALWLILRMLAGERVGTLLARIVSLALFAAAALLLDKSLHKLPEKKPFVLTARMKRLTATLVGVSVLSSFLISFLKLPPYVLFVGVPYLTFAAAYLIQPLETGIQRKYLSQARAKLDSMPNLIKIGITGSYGKTSVKHYLAAILSEKFRVLASAGSVNTPMGLCLTINKQLEPSHEVFVAEMGARYAGDIRELMEFVRPRYGVLTSVGPQHLETFGSIENIENTKFDLIRGLPKDGVGFFAADGGRVDALYEKATCEKYRAGIEGGLLAMRAEHIETGPWGSRFELCDFEGERVACETKLLGRFNVANVVLACCAAKRLGMTMAEIGRGVARIQPVEHRLQLVPTTNGISVIDDAFNANTAGAKAALDVLGAFPGRHIVVTPGFVEAGAQQDEMNYRLGTQIAAKCDVAILVGRGQTKEIARGALDGGLDPKMLFVERTLDDATQVLGRVGRAGDAVLFESDLPDHYNEK